MKFEELISQQKNVLGEKIANLKEQESSRLEKDEIDMEKELDQEERRLQMSQDQFRFEAEMEEKKIDRDLKKSVARIIFSFLGVETIAVFGVLVMQGFKPFAFQVEDTTLNIFLGATILQISAMAIMVIRHLFPTKENS